MCFYGPSAFFSLPSAGLSSCYRPLTLTLTLSCYLRVPLQLASPPGISLQQIPKGNLTRYHTYNIPGI